MAVAVQASMLIKQMYAPDDRPRIIAVSADTLQVDCAALFWFLCARSADRLLTVALQGPRSQAV